MLGATIAIVVPSLVLVETKMRSQSEARMSREFDEQVAVVLAERAQRLENVSRVAEEVADSAIVKRALAGEEPDDERQRDFIESLLRRKEGAGGAGARAERTRDAARAVIPLACVVNLDGEITELTPNPAFPGVRRRQMDLRHGESLEKLRKVAQVDMQQVGYIITQTGPKGERLQEVVVTPVYDGKELRGMFLLGIDAETPIDQLFSRLERATDGASKSGGFFAEGRVVQLHGLKNVERQELTALVAGHVGSAAEGKATVELNGDPYRLIWRELNPGSVLPEAYQIAFFPLGAFRAEMRDIEIRMLLLGLVAVVLATLASFWIARSLARPVQMLERATERIRAGDFQTRVAIASRDEIGRLGQSFNEMAEGLALKERYHEVLSKVSDAAVAQALLEGKLELGGETRFLTVLFCDIRGFTTLTERMTPHEIIELLNEHMTAMTEVVYDHRGVVDKFVGDEIMAIFGAPKAYGDDTANALRCALAMVARRRELNRTCAHPFEIGIGVASGEMVAGCMGSVDRLNYTVVGERVNLASRLCSQAGPGEVLAAVLDGIADGDPIEIAAKGFRDPVRAVRLRGVRTAPGHALA